MPKGGKLSYKSVVDCFISAESDSDRVACRKHFGDNEFEKMQSEAMAEIAAQEGIIDSTEKAMEREELENRPVRGYPTATGY